MNRINRNPDYLSNSSLTFLYAFALCSATFKINPMGFPVASRQFTNRTSWATTIRLTDFNSPTIASSTTMSRKRCSFPSLVSLRLRSCPSCYLVQKAFSPCPLERCPSQSRKERGGSRSGPRAEKRVVGETEAARRRFLRSAEVRRSSRAAYSPAPAACMQYPLVRSSHFSG